MLPSKLKLVITKHALSEEPKLLSNSLQNELFCIWGCCSTVQSLYHMVLFQEHTRGAPTQLLALTVSVGHKPWDCVGGLVVCAKHGLLL